MDELLQRAIAERAANNAKITNYINHNDKFISFSVGYRDSKGNPLSIAVKIQFEKYFLFFQSNLEKTSFELSNMCLLTSEGKKWYNHTKPISQKVLDRFLNSIV